MAKSRISQGQRIQQDLRLYPQQIQIIKLLEMPVMEFEEKLKEEVEENPALEEVTDDDDEINVISENNNENEEDREKDISEEDNDEENVNQQNEEEFSFSDFLSDDEKEDTPYYQTNKGSFSGEDEQHDFVIPLSSNFYDNLKEQIQFLKFNEKQKIIANYILGSIDDKGYLQRDTDSIVDDLLLMYNIKVSVGEVEYVISQIQTLDPPGICARNIQENFLIQLKRKHKTQDVLLAIKIIEKQFENLMKKHYNKIMERLNIDEEEFKRALNVINKLNINPADTFTDNMTESKNIIVPDFIVDIIDDVIQIQINSANTPELRVSKKMMDLYDSLKKNVKKNKEEIKYLEENINKARLFIDAVEQRQNTMMSIMRSIVQFQSDFFYEGDAKLIRPMILKDIAEKTSYDISTISRVVSNKYVQTPYGIFPLKIFFSEPKKTSEDEEISVHVFKEKLLDLINNEDKRKPYTDEELTKLLNQHGFKVARRTVTKYRESMNIPVARLRKEI